ncbi:MFS transporter [Actinoplanes oblitus]|uniref:MFS transporter n=1 Tax=Actinoplanes oblitus TaxID=3040509 RepID=A0ABY8WQA7_9ACTN|nr:MFS transporter [Actinoplanes oblitus]WIN00085.1 MFS transporter [Actinoplanes oblitus]
MSPFLRVINRSAARTLRGCPGAHARAGHQQPFGLAVLLVARGAALTANRMLLVVLPAMVLAVTGSVVQTGLITLCQVLPWVVMQVLSGPLLDRVAPQRIGACGDLLSATVMVVLAVTGLPPLWLLAVLMAAVGAADGPATAAKTVLLRPVAEDTGIALIRATGWTTAVERSAGLGPYLGGLAYTRCGLTVTLLLVATLFALGSLASATISTPVRHEPATGTYRQQFATGVRFLHADRSLAALMIMFAVTNMLDRALFGGLLPVWASRGGHDTETTGLAISAFAGTAAVTAALMGWRGDRLDSHRRGIYLAGMSIAGVSRFAVIALNAPPTLVLIVWAVAGLGSGAGNPVIEAIQCDRIPEHLQGRIRTQIIAGAWTGIPFGGLAAAALLTLGLPAALWLCATAYLAAVAYPGWRVTWHTTPTTRSRPAPVPATSIVAGESA